MQLDPRLYKYLTDTRFIDFISGAVKCLNESLVESCADSTGGKARARDLAHNAADDRVHGNLSSASVILHVVSETECLLTEDRGKLLLLLDLFV